MVFKEYTNENFGTYHTHTVDDVYEAMYIAKYPQRIKDSTNLKEDRRALNAINKYKVDVANSSLQDALIKHKVQVVNPRNKTNFMPGFAYVKHTQKAWAPVVLPERMHGGSANKTTTGGGVVLGKTVFSPAVSATNTTINNDSTSMSPIVAPAQKKQKGEKMTTSSLPSPIQSSQQAEQQHQSHQTGKNAANAAANAAEALDTNTPNINITSEKIESQKMEQSPEMIKAIKKINYILKHVIPSKALKEMFDVYKTNYKFKNKVAKLVEGSKLPSTNVTDGFALLNTKLPTYDLIDTVRELKRVYKYKSRDKNSSQSTNDKDAYLPGGGTEDETEDGTEDGSEHEPVEYTQPDDTDDTDEETYTYTLKDGEKSATIYNSWLDKYIFSWFGTEDSTTRYEVDPTSENFPFEMSKFLLHEDLEESDDEDDDDFEITPEEALTYLKESIEFASAEDKRIDKIQEDIAKKSLNIVLTTKTKISDLAAKYRIAVILTLIIGALFTYFIAMPGYVFAQTVMFNGDQAKQMFELPNIGDRTVVDLSKPFENTDVFLKLDGFQSEWSDVVLRSTKPPQDISISVKLPSTNIKLGESFTEKLKQYLTPTPTDHSTQCMLVKNPNKALSINQQLFASNEMVLGYFIEYVNFALPNKNLKSYVPTLFGESTTLVQLFENQQRISAKSYVDAATDTMIGEIVKNFNEFTKTMFESDDADVRINGFFKSINEQKPSSAFRHRMDKFKQILLDHYMHHRNALQFKDHNCQISTDDTNNIKLTLDHYTAGLLYDMRLNYETIAKRRVQVYVDTIPVFEKLFDIYGRYLNLDIHTSPPNFEESRVIEYNNIRKQLDDDFNKAVKEWKNKTEDTPDLRKMGAWLTVRLGDEKTKLGQFFNEIKSQSKEHQIIIERFEKRQKYRDIYNQFTTNIQKPIQLNKEVETIGKEAYETQVSALAKQTTSELFENINKVAVNANDVFGPILGRQFLGTLDMIVDSMNANIILPEDITTINVVAANKGFMAIYNAFVSMTGKSELGEALNKDLSKRIPFYDTIKAVIINAQDQQIQNYLRISKNAVRTLHTRLHNLRERTSNYDIITFSKVISNMDYGLLWDILKTSGTSLQEPHQNNVILDLLSGHTGDIINYLKNFSEPYLDMIMEIHQIETALIFLHMQNNILENADFPKYELYEKESDIGQFLSNYYSDDYNKYINMLTKKLFVFTGMSLTKDLLGTGIESTIIKRGGGSYDDDHEHLEKELIESFIDNAEKHNKTVMSRVHSVRDINMQLKKKLLKSFIKHNPHMGEKLLRYMNQARLEM